jgi:hypothetical protein
VRAVRKQLPPVESRIPGALSALPHARRALDATHARAFRRWVPGPAPQLSALPGGRVAVGGFIVRLLVQSRTALQGRAENALGLGAADGDVSTANDATSRATAPRAETEGWRLPRASVGSLLASNQRPRARKHSELSSGPKTPALAIA